MDKADLVIAGATGRVGRLLRAVWADAVGPAPLWTSRQPPGAPGWARWGIADGSPMPPARVLLLLAGVTAGPAEALAQNTTLAMAGCRAAAAAGASHVFIASSAAVYGPTGRRDAAEDGPTAPARPYGAAKLAMERAVQDWHAAAGRGAPGVTLLRIGNLAGADMLAASADGGQVVLDRFDDGQGPVRSYIGPVTLARVLAGLVGLIRAGRPMPAVLNLAEPGGVAMADLLAAAGIGFDWRPAPADALARVVLDVGRLRSLVPLPPADPARLVAEWRQATAARA